MAIDSAAKRLSMLGFGDDAFGVTPTGTVDAAARASFVDLYQGISLAGSGPSVYCNYYTFMSSVNTAVIGSISDSDTAVIGSMDC